MKKRGQVTIFIIVGILFVVGIIIVTLLIKGSNNNSQSMEANRVQDIVLECYNEVYSDLIYRVGIYGGYYSKPNYFTSYGVPVYRDGDFLSYPTKEEIERQIEIGLNEEIEECVDGFSDISDLEIKTDGPDFQASVEEDGIYLESNYPLIIKKGEKSESIEDFGEMVISLRLGVMYNIAAKISESEDPNLICITCIAKMAEENGVSIDAVDIDDDTILFIITDEGLNDEVFEFSFAMKK